MQAVPSPQPLLGAQALLGAFDADVLVIEETGDAREKLAGCPFAIVAYQGAPQRWDWPALKGRRVDIFPSATQQAWQAALTIKGYLVSLECDVWVIDTRHEPNTWDIADFIAEGGNPAKLSAYLERHRLAEDKPQRTIEELQAEGRELLANYPDWKVRPAAAREAPERIVLPEVEPAAPPAEDAPQPIATVADEFPDFRYRKHREVWDYFDLEMGPGGRPWANTDTAERILAEYPPTRTALWFDEFRNRTMLGDRDFDGKADAASFALMMQRDIHVQKMTSSTVAEACETYARKNGRHPIKEWLASLTPWDGVKRLETLLPLAFGTPADDYTAAVGRCFLIGMVARVMRPGCQLDTMPVLEGAQNLGKTSALRDLGGEWYSSNNAGMQEKDFLQGLQGYWLIEIEELESINRASLERTKAILSRVRDDFRWSHGKNVRSYPRQCVFAGTTNSDTWNADSTGARRFWPVACTVIDREWLKAQRPALFAEALARFEAGEDWYKVPVERAREEQEGRRVEDPWQPILERNMTGRTEYSVEDGMMALELKPSERDRRAAMRISDILKSIGWRVKIVKKDGKSTRIYLPIRQLVEMSKPVGDDFGDDIPF